MGQNGVLFLEIDAHEEFLSVRLLLSCLVCPIALQLIQTNKQTNTQTPSFHSISKFI